MIDKFKGKHDFLSNFHPCVVMFQGKPYPSTEHAYQAAKFIDVGHQEKIRAAETAGKAKKFGQAKTPAMVVDWEGTKLPVMEELIRQKFQKYPKLRAKLLATGHEQLMEKNHWHDTFWGVCDGVGQNWLGKLLMKIRDELTTFDVHTPDKEVAAGKTLSIFLAGPTPRAPLGDPETPYDGPSFVSPHEVMMDPDPHHSFVGGEDLSQPEIVRSWRPAAIELIKLHRVVEKVFVPELETWSPEADYDHQVDWEFAALKAAKVILFWVPRDLKTLPGFTTNHEFGYWLAKKPEKIVLGFPPGAPKMMYMKRMARLHGVPIFNNLEDTIQGAVEKVLA